MSSPAALPNPTELNLKQGLRCPAGSELAVTATDARNIVVGGWQLTAVEARRLGAVLTAIADTATGADTVPAASTQHDWSCPGVPQPWARQMRTPGAAVVLDTETTDLYGPIIEVAVIDAATGATLLDTRINPGPGVHFAAAATAVHGLTAADVATAPSLEQTLPQLLEVTAGRTVLAYNARYDHEVITTDCARLQLNPGHLADPHGWGCILEARRAVADAGTGLALNGGHRALADTLAAREALRALTDT